MATGSNLYMSFVNGSFQPVGAGSALAVNEITDVNFDLSGDAEEFYADGSRFPMLSVIPKNKRTVKVTSGDVKQLLTLPQFTVGAFSVTLMDAVNREGVGAMEFVLDPCLISGAPFKSATGKFADGDVTFMGYAPDGFTDPLSFTVATA